MNSKNVPLLVAALLSPSVSSAVCPTEKSTVFYLNGIGVDRNDTKKSTKRLDDVLIADSRVVADCVTVKPSYNYSANETIPYAGIALDLTEALIQKAAETGRNVTDATRSLLRLDDAAWIDDVLEAVAILASGPTYLVDSQIAEHLAAYQTEAQTSGTLILAGHSQGNYYANEEWNRLSATARERTHLVPVATPATSVADDGPYVTLAQDNWAAGVFALFGAPFANVSNTEPCIGDFNDRWNCHGWKESYMNGTNSRNLVVDDIIAALPTVPPPVPNQFFGAIVNGHFLQLHGFVPDSNSWAITRGNYDTPDETAWRNGVCASHLGDAQGNLEWLTRDYGANSNFSTTGFDLDTTLETKNGDGVSCQAPGTWYLAVYDASNVWAIRVLKGVVVLTQIDATHWTTVAP